MKITKTKDEILCQLPLKLVERLMEFQKEGVKYAVNKNGRCLIADEMGLGKTLQAISVAYYYRSEWPLLIIVPSSLRYCWIEEFEKWLPEINPGEINLVQSGNDASGIGSATVTITTFGLLSRSTSRIVREALLNQGFQVVIVDESHYIRNLKTISAKTVVPLIKNANRRILLSGTPALSRPAELYPQIDAICPKMFGSWWSFTAKYCDARLEWFGKFKRRNVSGAKNLEELQQKLASMLMIRREKSEVLTQLPPKQRQKILFELKDSDLKKDIRKMFEELRPIMKKKSPETFEVLTGAADHDTKDTNVLTKIRKLYQLSGEAKIGPVKEYVEMLCENPKLKFLVFAYHHCMMDGLSQSLYDRKVKFIRIDGGIPQSERHQLVQQFQSDPDTRVAVLSILAAGVGLTFTAATVVVFAEMYWTPGMMVQCEDRAHRIGQTDCVAVHYLVAKDTVDEWVWSSVCKKTIVTSTTLTGKKKELAADAGDQYQVDILSHADVWVPKDTENLDLTSYFQTQQDINQKSIRSFFSPSQTSQQSSQSPTTSIAQSPSHRWQQQNASALSRKLDISSQNETALANPSKRARFDSSYSCNHKNKRENTESEKELIIIDSGSDDDFDDKKEGRNSMQKSSMKKSKKRKRMNKKKASSPTTPKCNLVAMFANKTSRDGCNSSIVLSDSEEEAFDRSKVNDEGKKKNTEVRTSDNSIIDYKIDDSSSLSHTPCSSKILKDSVKQSKNTTPVPDHSSSNQSTEKSCDLTNRWSCPACTYFNHKDIIYCEMCETPKKLNRNKATKIKKYSKVIHSIKNNDVEKNQENEQTFDNCRIKDDHFESDTDLGDVSFTKRTVHSLSDSDSHSEMDGDIQNCCSPQSKDNENSILDNCDKDYFPSSGPNSSETESCDMNSAKNQNENNMAVCTETVLESNGNNGVQNLKTESRYFNKMKNDKQSMHESNKPLSREEVSIKDKHSMNDCKTPHNKEDEASSKNYNMQKSDVIPSETCMSPVTSQKKHRFKSVRRNSLTCRDANASPSIGPIFQIAHSVGGNLIDSVADIKEDSMVVRNTAEESEDLEKTPKAAADDEYTFSSPELEKFYSSEIDAESMEHLEVNRKSSPDKRIVNIDDIPVHATFRYCCSKYTGRIYLHTQEDVSLDVNFVPVDVEVENFDDLPDLLLHPNNLRLVQKFVREWQSLTETKRRLIIKTGRTFVSPLIEYDELRSCKSINTQRHKTKMDTTQAAIKKATEVSGSVRVISKHSGARGKSENQHKNEERGITQALGADGTPLCLQCFKPYENHLLQKSSVMNEENAWQTRFCSQKCSQEFWMVTNNDYMRDKVYEAEHGICQMCNFDAHSLFRQIRDTRDSQKRAEIVTRSKFNSLTVKTKQLIVKKPVAGQFWHVDHIVPVWEGGGQCDIDNLRTLCVICHQKITAKQAAKRATVRKLGSAVNSGDITAFFQRK